MVVSRRWRRGAALGVVIGALALGGCGRHGKLEPPTDPNNPFALEIDKQTTRDPNATADQPEQKGKLGTRKRPKAPPIKPPNEPFILDPLL